MQFDLLDETNREVTFFRGFSVRRSVILTAMTVGTAPDHPFRSTIQHHLLYQHGDDR